MNRPFAQTCRRILVVDDNPAIHSDFKKILCPATASNLTLEAVEADIFGQAPKTPGPTGFQVDSAFQGQEAFALVEQSVATNQPYSVVLMDVRMPPGWDGIETTARIWGIAPDIQIVICTAYSDYSWEEMITRLGISDRLVILKKPFDNVEVIQLAHALTEKWRLGREARLKMEQMEAIVAGRTSELQAANEQLKVELSWRKKTEEALRQSQKMEAIGQLAGGIAHDFNNILAVIRGCVDCLLIEERQTPEDLETLREIEQATDRAAQLTSQILLFSRKKRMLPQPMNLTEAVSSLASMLRRVLGEHIVLQFDCDPNGLPVHADPIMMEQVLLNIVMNARDAMPQGGKLAVTGRRTEVTEDHAKNNPQARSGHFVCVSVTDTGCGIAPAVLPRLFDPFFTTKEPGKGTGLGLATVYSIVQQHQGWIEVESHPGQGARFSVFLPLGTLELGAQLKPSPGAKIPRGTETILLVEDEPALHRLTRTNLQRQGYRVYDAHTGIEAVSIWDQHWAEIDLLLTDMVMPGEISGRKLAQTLKSQKQALKIIYTTGYSAEALQVGFQLDDGVNFIPKPYTLEKLTSTIRQCLDKT